MEKLGIVTLEPTERKVQGVGGWRRLHGVAAVHTVGMSLDSQVLLFDDLSQLMQWKVLWEPSSVWFGWSRESYKPDKVSATQCSAGCSWKEIGTSIRSAFYCII